MTYGAKYIDVGVCSYALLLKNTFVPAGSKLEEYYGAVCICSRSTKAFDLSNASEI